MSLDKKFISAELEDEHKDVVKETIEQIIDRTYRRETRGRKPTGKREDKGAYHKITISMTEQEKEQIHKYANGNNVSQLIKDALRGAGVLK